METCEECTLGKTERVVGNGITEPPYVWLIRCPFDTKFYHYPDDACNFAGKRAEIERGGGI